MAMVIRFAYIFNDSKIVTAVPDWWHKSLFMKGCLAGQVLNSTTSQTSENILYVSTDISVYEAGMKGFIYWILAQMPEEETWYESGPSFR